MKKTFTINISGTVFHIEDDAYEKLQAYILKLKQHFGESDEGKEILADIEGRIAELFAEKMRGEKEVVVLEWVDEVIGIMGKPEDFLDESEEEPEIAKRKRRLYRDPDHRVIGGVCGGLGAYFNMDPVVLRIIFLVLFLLNGVGLIAYLILWIAVPKAVNTAQRLEMRGQEVTVSNIEKSIKEEVKDVKDSFKKYKETDPTTKKREGAGQFGDIVYNILKVVLKIFVVIVGVILVLIGFFGLLGFISSLIIGHSFVSDWPLIWSPELHMPGVLDHFVSPGAVTAGIICIAFLIGIPLLALLFVGTKLLFRYKTNNAAIALAMVGIWLVALITVVVLSAGQIGNFKKQTSLSSNEPVECSTCKTLYLELGEDKWQDYAELDWDIDRFKLVASGDEQKLLGQPRLDVQKSLGDNFVIVIKKQSRGHSQEEAKSNIQQITYNYTVKDSTVYFDPWFSLGSDGQWRDQKVEITVKVPEGKAVYLGKKMDKIIYDIDNVSNTWDGDMIGQYWEMKPEGLTKKETAK